MAESSCATLVSYEISIVLAPNAQLTLLIAPFPVSPSLFTLSVADMSWSSSSSSNTMVRSAKIAPKIESIYAMSLPFVANNLHLTHLCTWNVLDRALGAHFFSLLKEKQQNACSNKPLKDKTVKKSNIPCLNRL